MASRLSRSTLRVGASPSAPDVSLVINRAIITSIVATFVGLAVIGILRSYSPIPIDDDWNGYLGFYADLLDGKLSAWFAEFGGHRLILARVLFWLDIRYFGGHFVFLIAANLVILCGVIAIFIAYLRRLTSERCVQFVIGATICITAVSWQQAQNLTRGFYGANFFITMLLPLVAFYWLARAREQRRFFWLALLAGFASAWNMANGILVLPLLATLALCIGLNPARIATLAIAGVATIAFYFDFASNVEPSILGAYWSTLTGDPIGAAQYALGFLGNPFYYVVSYPLAALRYIFLLFAGAGQAPRQIFAENGLADYPTTFAVGLYIAQAAGVVLIAATMIVARRWFASGREATRGALLTFLLFIIITAVACAAGRLTESSSISFRYTTPALLAWVALIVLGAPSFNLRPALGIFACVSILLFPVQMLPVFGLRRVAVEHERMLQAMQGILQGSDNPETLSVLGADPSVVRRLRGTKVSIFAGGP
jgi:hypothetical protein